MRDEAVLLRRCPVMKTGLSTDCRGVYNLSLYVRVRTSPKARKFADVLEMKCARAYPHNAQGPINPSPLLTTGSVGEHRDRSPIQFICLQRLFHNLNLPLHL